MTPLDAAGRVERLLALRPRLADPGRDLGARFVAGLVERGIATLAGARLALDHLEDPPSTEELDRLVRGARPTDRCHLVLSANVPIAAFRAIALGLASSSHVIVKPSRRDPVLADLLIDALRDDDSTPLRVERVDTIAPVPGDHVMAYGADATLDAIARSLPDGVTLERHGTGFGIAIVSSRDDPAKVGERLARDVVVFDQRGCLSPRVVFVDGETAHVRTVARALAGCLERLAHEVPALPSTADDAHALAAYVRLLEAAAETVRAGNVQIGLDLAPRALLLPPPLRLLHVVRADGARAAALLGDLARYVTVVGSTDPEAAGLAKALPHARIAPPGTMQRPPLDGPVDRRPALVRGPPSG